MHFNYTAQKSYLPNAMIDHFFRIENNNNTLSCRGPKRTIDRLIPPPIFHPTCEVLLWFFFFFYYWTSLDIRPILNRPNQSLIVLNMSKILIIVKCFCFIWWVSVKCSKVWDNILCWYAVCENRPRLYSPFLLDTLNAHSCIWPDIDMNFEYTLFSHFI